MTLSKRVSKMAMQNDKSIKLQDMARLYVSQTNEDCLLLSLRRKTIPTS
jgi:hypothetical protein